MNLLVEATRKWKAAYTALKAGSGGNNSFAVRAKFDEATRIMNAASFKDYFARFNAARTKTPVMRDDVSSVAAPQIADARQEEPPLPAIVPTATKVTGAPAASEIAST